MRALAGHHEPPLPRRSTAACAGLLLVASVQGGCLPDGGSAGGPGEPIAGASTLGSLGEAPGRFAYPRAIDNDGSHLWVVDKSARVQELDAATGECLAWFVMPESERGKPVGITIGPGREGEQLLFVPDTHYHRVMVYRPPAATPSPADPAATMHPVTAELVTSFGAYGTGPGQFIYPTDVAILTSPDGARLERVYVSEYGGNDRVSVFDDTFTFLFSFGTYGLGEDPHVAEFQRPQSIAIDPVAPGGGEVYVVDSRNHRVGRFSLEGDLKGWIGAPDASGRDLGQFRYPYGLTLLGDGTALVAEFGNNRVQRIDLATGEGLRAWGRPGRGHGELATPWAITVMGSRTFVLDSGNNRVVAFPTPSRRRGGGGGGGA